MAEPGNPIAWNCYAYVYNSPVNYTDSSGHFIDTLWDTLDLAVDVKQCLGEADSLSCYMIAADVAFLVLPFVPGVVDNAVKGRRVVLHSDAVKTARVYDALASTEAGADIIQRAKVHGLPTVKFAPLDAVGRYSEGEHIIWINSRCRHVPDELLAPTLAHELTHRTRRWFSASLSDEFFAYTSQHRVWAELRGGINLADLSPEARELVERNDLVLNLAQRGIDSTA